MGEQAGHLSWGLCVATYNRGDILCHCVSLALAQTRPPAEIVIVDASNDWQDNRNRVQALLPAGAGPRLVYQQAQRRSLTAQRNQAIAESRADILFLIDDDSLMARDCAAAIMALYEADGGGQIVAIGAADLDRAPDTADATATPRPAIAAKEGAESRNLDVGEGGRIGPFLMRHLLMIPMEQRFVAYDRPEQRWIPAAGTSFSVPPRSFRVEFLNGYRLTARRAVLLREPFDDGLVGSSMAEDLDACYRLGRHGALILAEEARLYHAQAASGRSNRRLSSLLSVLNIAYFVRRNSTRPVRDFARYGLWYLRMLLAEMLKDLLRRRWSIPQTRGALSALRSLPGLLARTPQDVAEWYRARQNTILAGK